jgi:pyruvate dehydrogenase E2 component (dihydrolipoamide acetyltransferase)
MESGTILRWLKDEGATVRLGEELVEIETDKATMTYEAEAEGTLRILAVEGTTIEVGTPIAVLGAAAPDAAAVAADDGGGVPVGARATATPLALSADHGAPAAAPSRSRADGDGTRATPLARRVAVDLGVALEDVAGSGPRGRVTRGDVLRVAGVTVPTPVAPSAEAAPPPAPAPHQAGSAAKGRTTVQQLTRLQLTVARRMAEAHATAPDFVVETEVTMTSVAALRERLRPVPGRVPSYNDFIVMAAARALLEHPRANGSFRDGHFELHERVNVGIAVAAEDALLVPTIFDAGRRSLGAIALESRRLIDAVRSGTITPAELEGGTFTVSNLGMYGMRAITPVLNPPQAAILGVGAMRDQLALVDGEVVSRPVMTLRLSCDHRILYGADAALFLSAIRDGLEEPLRLAL